MRTGALLGEGGPATAWPGLRPPVVAHSGTTDIASPAAVRPAQGVDLRVVQVDPRAVRLEQPGRLVDDLLEDLGGLEDGRDAGRDLAQRPLGIGAAGDLGARALELLDQAGVRDRTAAWSASAASRPASSASNASGRSRVDGDDAEDLVAMDERRGDDRPDPALADEGVAVVGVREALVGRGSRRSTRPGGS